jgi:hypothetical protein
VGLICCYECGRLRERVPSRKGRCEDCARRMNRERYRRRKKGGSWTLKARVLRRDDNRCTRVEGGVRCIATEQLEVHHVNGNP